MNRFTGAMRGGLVAIAVSLVTLPALAQATTTPSTTSSTTDGTTASTSVDTRSRRGFDWGWLGLLGLAGLAGLRRRETHAVAADGRRPL